MISYRGGPNVKSYVLSSLVNISDQEVWSLLCPVAHSSNHDQKHRGEPALSQPGAEDPRGHPTALPEGQKESRGHHQR